MQNNIKRNTNTSAQKWKSEHTKSRARRKFIQSGARKLNRCSRAKWPMKIWVKSKRFKEKELKAEIWLEERYEEVF